MEYKITTILALIICFFGCFYQLFKINTIYFSNETTTNVMFEYENEVSLPAITLCFNKFYLFHEIFNKNFTANETVIDNKEIDHKFVRMTIAEQIEALEIYDNIISGCFIYHGTIKECYKINEIIKFINGFDLCFTIFSQLNGELDTDYDLKIDKNRGEKYIGITLNHRILSHSLITTKIHARSSFIYDIENLGHIKLNMSNSNHFEIIYEKKIINSLMGSCNENQSSSDCFAKCIINKIIEQNNSYPINYANYNLTSTYKFEDLYEEEEKFKNYCKQLCYEKIDCRQEFYILNKEEQSYGNLNNLFIKIIISTQQTTIYEISPKIYFEEDICLSLSIISLWFGFSILLFTKKILNSMKIIFIELKNKYFNIPYNDKPINNLIININATIIRKKRIKTSNIRASKRFKPVLLSPLNYKGNIDYECHI